MVLEHLASLAQATQNGEGNTPSDEETPTWKKSL